MSIKAVNASGGSGVFATRRFLAAAGLPWSLATGGQCDHGGIRCGGFVLLAPGGN